MAASYLSADGIEALFKTYRHATDHLTETGLPAEQTLARLAAAALRLFN